MVAELLRIFGLQRAVGGLGLGFAALRRHLHGVAAAYGRCCLDPFGRPHGDVALHGPALSVAFRTRNDGERAAGGCGLPRPLRGLMRARRMSGRRGSGRSWIGGTRLLEIRFGLLPQVLPVLLAQVLYSFESNTRSAAILGVVGAGGIGLQIAERIKVRYWDEVSFIIILILLTVAVIDQLSARVRRRLIG